MSKHKSEDNKINTCNLFFYY